MKIEEQPDKTKVFFAFAAIYLIWGSTFFVVSIALKEFPAFLLSSLRLLIAGAALLTICVIRREKFPSGVDIIKNALCGIVIFLGGIIAVVWSQQYISSSLASIIITTPFWFILLDKREWKFYFSSKWIPLGLITGLAGVILLLRYRAGFNPATGSDMQTISIFVMIGGSALWAAGSLYLKYNPTGTSIFVSTCVQLLAAGIFCFAISAFRQEPQHLVIDHIAVQSWLALSYLSIVSSLITFMAFIWLIKIKPPAIVSTYSYVNPVVAVLLGWGLGKEDISAMQLVSLAIILCGLLFVNIPKYKNV